MENQDWYNHTISLHIYLLQSELATPKHCPALTNAEGMGLSKVAPPPLLLQGERASSSCSCCPLTQPLQSSQEGEGLGLHPSHREGAAEEGCDQGHLSVVCSWLPTPTSLRTCNLYPGGCQMVDQAVGGLGDLTKCPEHQTLYLAH